jgi:hypothetical protein
MQLVTEQVVQYPITGDYDINVWCDNNPEDSKLGWKVHLTFYPLTKGEEYDVLNTSVYYTLILSAIPRGPKYREALNYLKNLVNDDAGLFDLEETDWWSNECVLTNAPKVITDFMAGLPREER